MEKFKILYYFYEYLDNSIFIKLFTKYIIIFIIYINL